MRRPREHGWLTEDGVVHHVDTRRPSAFNPLSRWSTCQVPLRDARRVRVERVDCMACIAITLRRPRLPPQAAPANNARGWTTVDGARHQMKDRERWRAWCGASLRHALPFWNASPTTKDCATCHAAIGDDDE